MLEAGIVECVEAKEVHGDLCDQLFCTTFSLTDVVHQMFVFNIV